MECKRWMRDEERVPIKVYDEKKKFVCFFSLCRECKVRSMLSIDEENKIFKKTKDDA